MAPRLVRFALSLAALQSQSCTWVTGSSFSSLDLIDAEGEEDGECALKRPEAVVTRATALLQITRRPKITTMSESVSHSAKPPSHASKLEGLSVLRTASGSAENRSSATAEAGLLQRERESRAGSVGSLWQTMGLTAGARLERNVQRVLNDANDAVLLAIGVVVFVMVAALLYLAQCGQSKFSAPLLASGVDTGVRTRQQGPGYNQQWAGRQQDQLQPKPFQPAPSRDFVCC